MSRICVRATIVFLLAAGRVGAASNPWISIGPVGGFVTGLAFDGSVANVAYATAMGGFFRSTDGGASWTASNDGLLDAQLQNVVTTGAVVYVGGSRGVYRSDDHGLQFRLLAGSPGSVSALAGGAGPNPPLFAAGTFAGAWRSDDGGTTWTEINEGLLKDQPIPATVHALLVDPRKPGLLWAGAESGVYRSLDGGAHWARTSSGLAGYITSLAIDSEGVLYAGAFVDPTFVKPLPAALFVSSDLGLTWHAAVRGLASRGVLALLADPAGAVWAGTQDAGVFRTANGGHGWNPGGTGTAGQAIGALAQAGRPLSLLLAGSGLYLDGALPREGVGIFRSTSSGARWAVSGPGPNATSIAAVVADAETSGMLTVADPYAGIFRTRTGGFRWALLNGGLAPGLSISELASDAASGELYASAGTPSGASGLYQRGSGPAVPWRQVTSAPAACGGPLAVGSQGQVLVGAFGPSAFGVCVSADAGATWTISGVGSIVAVASIALAPSNPARVYASGSLLAHAPAGPTFFRSDDGGVSWTGESLISTYAEHGLAVDPLNADVVYAASVGGLERSSDGGSTWEPLLTAGGLSMVRVDPRAPNTLYAAVGPTAGQPQLAVSDDGGATWSSLTEGLPPNVVVTDLAFDAASPSLLYAATAGGGVFTLRRLP